MPFYGAVQMKTKIITCIDATFSHTEIQYHKIIHSNYDILEFKAASNSMSLTMILNCPLVWHFLHFLVTDTERTISTWFKFGERDLQHYLFGRSQ